MSASTDARGTKTCHQCGCTDDRGCHLGGYRCSWSKIDGTLCTACEAVTRGWRMLAAEPVQQSTLWIPRSPHERSTASRERPRFASGGFAYSERHRARLWPFLVVVFLVAFLASALTLALSALSSSDAPAVFEGQSVARPTSDGSAVRAGTDAPSVELNARAGMESRHDRWAESEGRIGDAVPDNSPASDLYGPDAPAAAPARTAHAIEAIITNAAVEFGVDPDDMIRVARCESSLRVDAVGDNGAAVGLFQFHTFRWWLNAPTLGYHDDLRADTVAAARAAAYAFAHGQASAWTCR